MTKAKLSVSKKKKLMPRFGSALLSSEVTSSGIPKKVDIQGVLTVFWSWGFPCQRDWFIVLTLFNLQAGKTSIIISLRKQNHKEMTSLQVLDVEVDADNASATIPVRLHSTFLSEGRYEVVCAFPGDTRQRLKVPFIVKQQQWPVFEENEIDFVKSHPECLSTMSVNVHCKECKHVYVFQESILSSATAGGAIAFPENGEFECEDCGHVIQLKDIQGRARSTLKALLKNVMGGNC